MTLEMLQNKNLHPIFQHKMEIGEIELLENKSLSVVLNVTAIASDESLITPFSPKVKKVTLPLFHLLGSSDFEPSSERLLSFSVTTDSVFKPHQSQNSSDEKESISVFGNPLPLDCLKENESLIALDILLKIEQSHHSQLTSLP